MARHVESACHEPRPLRPDCVEKVGVASDPVNFLDPVSQIIEMEESDSSIESPRKRVSIKSPTGTATPTFSTQSPDSRNSKFESG